MKRPFLIPADTRATFVRDDAGRWRPNITWLPADEALDDEEASPFDGGTW